MGRSIWKGKDFVVELDNGSLIWDRGRYICSQDIGKFVRVHNGKNFVEVLVEAGMVGKPYGNYIITRRMGVGIHVKKGKKKSK